VDFHRSTHTSIHRTGGSFTCRPHVRSTIRRRRVNLFVVVFVNDRRTCSREQSIDWCRVRSFHALLPHRTAGTFSSFAHTALFLSLPTSRKHVFLAHRLCICIFQKSDFCQLSRLSCYSQNVRSSVQVLLIHSHAHLTFGVFNLYSQYLMSDTRTLSLHFFFRLPACCSHSVRSRVISCL